MGGNWSTRRGGTGGKQYRFGGAGGSEFMRRCHDSGGPTLGNHQLGPLPSANGRMLGGFDMGPMP